jgi:acyl carrier protein
MSDLESIRSTLKGLIVRSLRIDDLTADEIADDQPLLEGSLAIDSIDALQLVLEIERTFHVQLVTGKIWNNVSTLSAGIDQAIRDSAAQSA